MFDKNFYSALLFVSMQPGKDSSFHFILILARDCLVSDRLAGDPLASDCLLNDPLAGDPLASDCLVSDLLASDPLGSDCLFSDPLAGDPLGSDCLVSDLLVSGHIGFADDIVCEEASDENKSQMIPSQQAMMLEAAMAFEYLIKQAEMPGRR